MDFLHHSQLGQLNFLNPCDETGRHAWLKTTSLTGCWLESRYGYQMFIKLIDFLYLHGKTIALFLATVFLSFLNFLLLPEDDQRALLMTALKYYDDLEYNFHWYKWYFEYHAISVPYLKFRFMFRDNFPQLHAAMWALFNKLPSFVANFLLTEVSHIMFFYLTISCIIIIIIWRMRK